MKSFWVYTLARLGVFALTYAVVWLVVSIWVDITSLANLLVLIIALAVSSVISIFALAHLRDRLAADVQARAQRASQRIEESRRAEDVD